ncbi:uncharacterized protein 5-HT2B [Planococcus citri]|uniref:uncharacterized protein 5-HT2B n=1 Tax=Planococcus citri TaxID=170843 RepID=UPI0031F9BEDD
MTILRNMIAFEPLLQTPPSTSLLFSTSTSPPAVVGLSYVDNHHLASRLPTRALFQDHYTTSSTNQSGTFFIEEDSFDRRNLTSIFDEDDDDTYSSEAPGGVNFPGQARPPAPGLPRWWALSAFVLVLGTAAGNVLVCLAIYWERRLQNVTNYFLMSLAITDLMVAVLVMPMGILALVKGFFPLAPVYCLAWICLDVLFCTASIMHLCTISVDRYLSLRYPMSFGRNKTRRRVTLKILVVWILSFALSLPLSLMYSQDYNSLLIDGTCQIPNPAYRVIGSIVSFYIPLVVMLVTYWLTVRLLDVQRKNLGTPQPNGWSTSEGWTSNSSTRRSTPERKYTWKKFITTRSNSTDLPSSRHYSPTTGSGGMSHHATLAINTSSIPSSETTPRHQHSSSAASSDTEYTTLDTHDLWLPDYEPTPSTLSALHQFGKEMLRLSSGLQNVDLTGSEFAHTYQGIEETSRQFKDHTFPFRKRSINETETFPSRQPSSRHIRRSASFRESLLRRVDSAKPDPLNLSRRMPPSKTWHSTEHIPHTHSDSASDHRDAALTAAAIKLKTIQNSLRNKSPSRSEDAPPTTCRCPYFGKPAKPDRNFRDVVIIYSEISPKSSLVKWEPRGTRGIFNRRSSFTGGGASGTGSTSVSLAPGSSSGSDRLRRSATVKQAVTVASELSNDPDPRHRISRAASTRIAAVAANTNESSSSARPYGRNSSVMMRNTTKHGRIIRLEQKATKVLGVVFFTFVILWAPFFVLNLIPAVCDSCEKQIPPWIFDIATWLGYASSMVNPIFYTIFNKVFRQAFKKVLMCKYRRNRRHRWKPVKR